MGLLHPADAGHVVIEHSFPPRPNVLPIGSAIHRRSCSLPSRIHLQPEPQHPPGGGRTTFIDEGSSPVHDSTVQHQEKVTA
jgi:hypothetical protein